MRRLAPFALFTVLAASVYSLLPAQQAAIQEPKRFLGLLAVGDQFLMTNDGDGKHLSVRSEQYLAKRRLTAEEEAEYQSLVAELSRGDVATSREGKNRFSALVQKRSAAHSYQVVAVGDDYVAYREEERIYYMPERRINMIDKRTSPE